MNRKIITLLKCVPCYFSYQIFTTSYKIPYVYNRNTFVFKEFELICKKKDKNYKVRCAETFLRDENDGVVEIKKI